MITLEQGKTLWANLFIDGKAEGQTPLTVTLAAGAHQLELRRDGYRPVARKVTLSCTRRENKLVLSIVR